MNSDLVHGKLVASFAHRLGYIDDVQLAAACAVWRRDQSRSLVDLLVACGAIDSSAQKILTEMVKTHLAKYGEDAEACYAGILEKGWVPSVLVDEAAVSASNVGETIEPVKPVPSVPGPWADDATVTISLGSYSSGGSRYRLGRRIGAGGQGEVYEALDTELNRDVLLKQVVAKHANDPESRGQFLRETRTGANLEHPGIVPVYDIGQHPGGQLFQVMRYFRPGSLHKKIANYYLASPDTLEELSFRTLLGHFATACRAIDYAHSRGILHLDIKPQNIVTGEFGETQIIDWGLAQVTDGDMLDKVEEESGTLAGGSSQRDSKQSETGLKQKRDAMPRGFRGTPAYAAPEQWKGDWKTIGPRTDVYGLGATLFEILASKSPYQSTSPTIAEDVEIGNVHREMKPWVAAGLKAISRKAMAIKPEDRYDSAGALADDVDRFLADEPLVAYPDPWQVRLWRLVKRNRTAVAAAVALLSTTAVALAIGNVLVSQQRDKAIAAEKDAVDQRDLAKRNAAMTREVIAEFVEKIADDEWGSIPGTGVLRLAAVQSVVDKFPELIAQQPDDPELQYDAALIYRRCANLYRLLQKLDEAAPLYEQSRKLMQMLIEQHPQVEHYRLGWCHNLLDEAEVIFRQSGSEAAMPTYREALRNAETSVEQFPESHYSLRTLAQAQLDLAANLESDETLDERVRLSVESVRNLESVMARDSDDDDEGQRKMTRLIASMAASNAADALSKADRTDEARGMAEKADRISAALSEKFSGDPNVDYVRSSALSKRARMLLSDDSTAAEGRAVQADAIELLRRLVAASPQETNFRPALSRKLCDQAETLLDNGNVTDAIKAAEEAIEAVATLDQPDGAAEVKHCLANAHAMCGRALKSAGDTATAKEHFQRASEYYEALVAAEPENKEIRKEAADIGRLLAE
jgi:serine/threonine protein kinase